MSECKNEHDCIPVPLGSNIGNSKNVKHICRYCVKTRDEIILESKLAASEQALAAEREKREHAESLTITEQAQLYCAFQTQKKRAEQAEAEIFRIKDAMNVQSDSICRIAKEKNQAEADCKEWFEKYQHEQFERGVSDMKLKQSEAQNAKIREALEEIASDSCDNKICTRDSCDTCLQKLARAALKEPANENPA